MENFIEKTCPFCKTVITESDTVTICPSCGIPHHQSCWEENHGCATCGCSVQKNDVQHTNTTIFCAHCGASLSDGHAFCPKCGKKIELSINPGVNSTIDQYDTNIEDGKKAKTKKPLMAIIAIAVIAISVLVAPKLFVSVEDLCAQGQYEKAYEKANTDEKLEIKAENAAAVQSAFSADNLKDPDSFVLRDAYYNEGNNDDGTLNKQLVLRINAANSYGASVSSYWLYSWDDEEDTWKYFCSVSDLDNEEVSNYDDYEELWEKELNNIGRYAIKNTMNDGIKLSKDAVTRINAMFEEGILDEVELLDVD